MTIATIADVQRARALNRWLGRPPVDEVILAIDLEPEERLALQSRLEALFNDCGCIWGPPAFLVASLSIALPGFLAAGFAWRTAAAAFALGALAAMTAKFAALYVSHVRLARELERLTARMH